MFVSLRPALVASLTVLSVVGNATSAAAQDPDYVLSLVGSAVEVGTPITVPVVLDSTAGDAMGGWAYGVCHDPAALTITSVDPGPYIGTFVNGGPPQFWQLGIEADGYWLGAVIFAAGLILLQPGEYVMTTSTYDSQLTDGESTPLQLCPDPGPPFQPIVMSVQGQAIPPVTNDTTVSAHDDVPFIRGDANDDGIVNIADVIALLGALFLDTGFQDCFGADDANGDGHVDIADPIKIWASLFSTGAPPPAPYPDCASSPSGEACRSRSLCP